VGGTVAAASGHIVGSGSRGASVAAGATGATGCSRDSGSSVSEVVSIASELSNAGAPSVSRRDRQSLIFIKIV
jgi:hypothetical protein